MRRTRWYCRTVPQVPQKAALRAAFQPAADCQGISSHQPYPSSAEPYVVVVATWQQPTRIPLRRGNQRHPVGQLRKQQAKTRPHRHRTALFPWSHLELGACLKVRAMAAYTRR